MTTATNSHNKTMKNRTKGLTTTQKNDLWKIFDTENQDNGKILSIPLDTSEVIHRNCTHYSPLWKMDSRLVLMQNVA
jgi:hypothetical protein